jgi:polyisoprenoid-binding protein YceI
MMIRLLTTVLLMCLLVGTPAHAERFEVRPGEDGSTVRFESKAPLESFTGSTDQISGYIDLDPASVGDSITVYMEVDLASLDTGIGRRNGHMRERHLETDEYPTAVFTGATVLSPASSRLDVGQPVSFEIEGDFDLHGVKRRLRTTVEVTYMQEGGARLHVVTTFRVTLADHNISRPKFLFLKLEETQSVTFDAVAIRTE